MKPYVTLSEKGQVVLPKEVRSVLGVEGGDKVYFLIEDNKVTVSPYPKSMAKFTQGLGKEFWRSIDAEKYISEERKSWKKKK